jgi:hypothetical protein
MDEPWPRDGRVRADFIKVAPDVSGAVVDMSDFDNQFVHKAISSWRSIHRTAASRWNRPRQRWRNAKRTADAP